MHNNNNNYYHYVDYEDIYVPELLHNLQVLVDDTEEDIITHDRRYKYNQDNVVNLSYEKNRLEELIIDDRKQVEKLTQIMNVIGMWVFLSLSLLFLLFSTVLRRVFHMISLSVLQSVTNYSLIYKTSILKNTK